MTSDWETRTLKSVSTLITKGTTPTTLGGSFSLSGGIKFVKVQSITDDGCIDLGKVDYIDSKTNLMLSRSALEENDVLFTIAGTIGRSALVPKHLLPANTNQAVALIRPDRSQIHPRFLFYVLRDRTRVRAAESRVVQSVQANFSLSELGKLGISLPSMAEQRSITSILGALDDKIELNRKMNETLEAIARAIFKSWFVDFDPVRAKVEGRDTGLPAEISELFPDSFEDSELGAIPSGWKRGEIRNLVSEIRELADPSSIAENTPYIALEHVPRRSIALHTWGNADGVASNKARFREGDILFGKLRPYFHKVGVAPVNGVCSTDIVVCRPKRQNLQALGLLHLSSDQFVNYVDRSSTGTKMPRTKWADMAEYAVMLPSEPLIDLLHRIVSPMIERVRMAILENRCLAEVRDMLLPKLISGELRIPDAECIVEEMV